MRVERGAFDGVLLFVPTPHHDDRGLFTRTFDAAVAKEHGLDPAAFIQDSQSRSRLGTIRALHGRTGRGEAKLVRCARGAIHDVLVDARPTSPTYGQSMSVVLDDETFACLYVPAGFLHGFQALTEQADICYRIDREHDPAEDISVRYDDPDLAIAWPLPVTAISSRDLSAGSWKEAQPRLLG
ncbi:dTDP-4-dehydrorhamnose 3,5-epimerase family protein [Nonomuraea sp. H19]|uniref:dTDP-4-dehydrorhamnose 3,5-epimerase family protein n=1 Tax=Nonomuraea sp. H19 TaxID=3452206 RepID=UPI003F8AD444